MEEPLTKSDFDMIFTSLQYTRQKFEEYQQYPSYEYKQERIKEVCTVINKLQTIIAKMKKGDKP